MNNNNWTNVRKIISSKYKIADIEIDQLQTLSLSKNKLTVIPPEIGNLKQLLTLDLHINELTVLPHEICNLKQLRKLFLSYNKLTVIPPEIGNLEQLRTLDLSQNKLTFLPPEIGKLSQLQALDLSYNQITVLPPEICNLKQLQTLNLPNNKLTVIQPEICNLEQLQTLNLSYNKLKVLPPEIGNLRQLQELYFLNNQLTVIPPEIGNLLQLQKLSLSNNKLTAVPIHIIYLPNLTYFMYTNNEITNLHSAITRWLNKLKTTQNVYSNNQSVHDHNIESTTNASIIKFVSSHQVQELNLFELINKLSISTKIKNLLKSYCNYDYIHSNLKLTFGEVALPLLDYINTHVNKEDLLKILEDEMNASEGKCFQGRLSRLINVINGYHKDVNINISDNAQIGNVVIMLKKQYPNINLNIFIGFFAKEMNERNYELKIIEEWIAHVKENY